MKVWHLFWAAMIGAAIAACGDVQGAGAPCASPAQCDDMNAWPSDTCEHGFCVNKLVPDGDSPAQTPGDCKKIVCAGGVAQVTIDSTDVEPDGNDCTVDICSADGTPGHVAAASKAPCMFGGKPGFCNGVG